MVYLQFRQTFKGLPFCGEWAEKHLLDISFDSGSQEIVFLSLLLISYAYY